MESCALTGVRLSWISERVRDTQGDELLEVDFEEVVKDKTRRSGVGSISRRDIRTEVQGSVHRFIYYGCT